MTYRRHTITDSYFVPACFSLNTLSYRSRCNTDAYGVVSLLSVLTSFSFGELIPTVEHTERAISRNMIFCKKRL